MQDQSVRVLLTTRVKQELVKKDHPTIVNVSMI